MSDENYAGTSWDRVPGLMVQLSLHRATVSWAVDRDNRLWMRRVDIGTGPDPVDPGDVVDQTC